MAKAVKSIPSTEDGPGLHYTTLAGKKFFISMCRVKERFTLWEVASGGYVKLGTADSPLDLCEMADSIK